MKISKLFHWLYAFLMALPIFAVLSACLISTFNMNTKEKAVINYKYEKGNAVYPYNLSLGLNKLYHLDDFRYKDFVVTSDDYYLNMYVVNCELSNFVTDGPFVDDVFNSLDLNTGGFRIDIFNNTNDIYIDFITFNSGIYYGNDSICLTIGDLFDDVTFDSIDFYFLDNYSVDNFLNYYVFPLDIRNLVGSDYNEILSVELLNVDSQDIFYNSLDKVIQSPIFNWAYNSNLLGVPISYIGGIFGLTANSFINVLLCYWIAISIIWLVFDVLMFLPLLVHKTLDKMRF